MTHIQNVSDCFFWYYLACSSLPRGVWCSVERRVGSEPAWEAKRAYMDFRFQYWAQHLLSGYRTLSKSNLLKPHFFIWKMKMITRALLWKAKLVIHPKGAFSHCKGQGECSGDGKGHPNPTEQQDRSEAWVKMTKKRGRSVMAPIMFLLLIMKGSRTCHPKTCHVAMKIILGWNHLKIFIKYKKGALVSLFLPKSRR